MGISATKNGAIFTKIGVSGGKTDADAPASPDFGLRAREALKYALFRYFWPPIAF